MGEATSRGAIVGRTGEIARLVGALDGITAAPPSGRTIVIGGEAGIGKTRLVEAFGEVAAQRGVRMLSGACLPTGMVPYAPFVEWLRTLTRSVDPERLPALLGPARDEIGRLLPGVARPSQISRGDDTDRAGQSRLFEAVLSVIERLANDGPTVISIEDAQWADEGTRSLTTFVSRNLRDAAVLLLISARSDEIDAASPVARWLAELDREAWVERMEVGPLDRGQVGALVRSISTRPRSSEEMESIFRRSGGNPFYVEQLAADLDEGRRLPPALRDVLSARFADFPEATQRVLRGAAAAGRRVDDDLLASVLGMPPGEVADALRPALAGAILVDVDGLDDGIGGYAFRHALLAEVAYDSLLHGERVRLHSAFGQELERRGEIGGMPVTEAELAHHWVASHDHDRAIPALIAAGLAAEHVYAFAEARAHFDLALELWDRTEPGPPGMDRVSLLQRTAECAVLSGAYDRAVALGREAITTAELDELTHGRPDPARLGALHDRLRWYLWEAGEREAAERAVEEALRLIPASPPTKTRARALGQAAGLHLFGGDPVEAGALAREAAEVARAAGAASEEAFALGILGWSEAVTGEVDQGIATYRDALAVAERLGGVEGIALGHANLAALLDEVGRSEASLGAALEGFAIAQRFGVARTYGGELLGDASKALFDMGRWDEAAERAEQGLELDPLGPAASWLHVNRARVHTNRGEFDDAEEHLDRARVLAHAGQAHYRGALLAAMTELAAARRRLPAVRALVDQVLASAPGSGPGGSASGWAMWHGLRAEADAAVDDRARGDDAAVAAGAARIREIAKRVAGANGIHVVLCRAEIDRFARTIDDSRWDAIASSLESLGRPALAAYARYRQGEAVLGRRGERAVAAEALRSAFRIADRLGADPLRNDIERLGRQARIKVTAETDDDAAPGDDLGLTPREAEVIRLVAAGRSNQQIADALFITRKTASVHVSNILGKLGVTNRVEAAAIAQRLGMDDAATHHEP